MKYFIIIDMQNDFCTGALKNDAAVAIIPKIVEKAKELKEQGWKIIATRDTHFDNYMNTQEGKNLPVPHCIKDTKGWEVVEELKHFIDEYVDKNSFGFSNWTDVLYMKDSEVVEEIAMCGTCTSICVTSNFSILKANYSEVPITVYKDLCACLTPETHEAAISVMKCQQAIIK
jgi:nicotinamidase-related amidase